MLFITVIAMVSGYSFYQYTNRQYEETEAQTMRFYGKHIKENIVNNIESMINITGYLLSAENVLDSLYSLAAYHTIDNYDMTYRIDAMETINKSINTDYINRNFYRIIIFNKYGDILVNKNYGMTYADTKKNIKEISWLHIANEFPGENIIVGQHTDDWGVREKPQVYSVVKKMIGSMECYIEVQYKVDDVNSFINMYDENKQCMIYNSRGEIILSSDNIENKTDFASFSEYDNGNYESENSIIVVDKDKEYGITVIIEEDKFVWMSNVKQILIGIFVVAGVFILVSLTYVWASVTYLTKPVMEMKKIIDETELSNLGETQIINIPVNEIEALKLSYQKLLERLRNAMIKERHMATLNLQAQLDILQSQINPHFLYNVLNVISGRGIINGDEEICNLCGGLASMLRYTTNTIDRNAFLREEIDYVEKYGYLLKSRYQERLEFTIDIPKDMKEIKVPKMIIQQIVENCVEHGFRQNYMLKIEIRGNLDETQWSIVVTDNGKGFMDEKKKEIYRMFEMIKSTFENENQLYEAKIGGMGIANAYARMYFMFGNRFEMLLENDNGAKVTMLVRRDNNV